MMKFSKALSLVALAIGVFPVSTAIAQPRKNTVVGFIWEYHGKKVVDDKLTGEEIKGKFRVFEREAFRGPKKVGVVKPNGNLESTLTITEWPEMNGTVKLKKVGLKPPVWQGLFHKEDGTKWRMTITFQKS